MLERKRAEIEWADFRRSLDGSDPDQAPYLANVKYYSVVRQTTRFVDRWIREHCRGKDVFEMACGSGGYALRIGPLARSTLAADIAPRTIALAIEQAAQRGLGRAIEYRVLDCEQTGLPDASFDVICEGGALHHMDAPVVFREAARLLRPGGRFLCVEALRHNPLIQLYRRTTPHLRTRWEARHILGRREIEAAAEYFAELEIHFFHLATLLAAPLRKTRVFEPLLTLLEAADRLLLRIPGLRWMAWQCVFVLSEPRKEACLLSRPADRGRSRRVG